MKPFIPRKHRWIHAAVVASAAVLLFTGCNETSDIRAYDDTLKQEISAAFKNQEQLQNYTFNGEFKIDWEHDEPFPSQSTPFGAILSDGVRWNGMFYREPLRLQADAVIGTEGSGPLSIPLLIQDNKLYASIPMINKENEFIAIDLTDRQAKDSVPVDELLQAGAALNNLAMLLFAEMDPEAIRLYADAQADGETGNRRYEVAVTESNAEELADYVLAGLSKWLETIPEALLDGSGSEEALTAAEGLQLAEGGTIRVSVNADGFVSETLIDVSFVREADDAIVQAGALRYAAGFSDLNQSPPLTREIPTNVLPLENILRFIIAGQNNG